MAERVLITGGAGFLGFHLAMRLAREGAEVTVVDDLSRGRLDSGLEAHDRIRFIMLDLTRPIRLRALNGGFDAVYHLAGVVGVQRSLAEPWRVLRTNVLAALNVLEWCARHPPRTLLFSSTSEVANGAVEIGHAHVPTPEEVPFVLVNPAHPRATYAMSKMLGELAMRHGAGRWGLRIVRYHNVYGPRMGNAHVIPQFINRILDGTDPFPIYGGYQSRAFCYVSDAVEATLGLMRVETDEPVVVNVGNDREEVMAIELARRLFTITGVDPELKLLEPPEGSPGRRRPDLTALRRLVDFEPRVSLDDGLRRTYEWQVEARRIGGRVAYE